MRFRFFVFSISKRSVGQGYFQKQDKTIASVKSVGATAQTLEPAESSTQAHDNVSLMSHQIACREVALEPILTFRHPCRIVSIVSAVSTGLG
jgi:hypothetical protein